MNKIKTKVSRGANFVYHMLSVAKCGYDNEYGRMHAGKHSSDDLRLLKDNEKLLTVSGGEHCGELYGIFVATPASLDSPAVEYYHSLKLLFETGDTQKFVDAWKIQSLETMPETEAQAKEVAGHMHNSFSHLRPQLISLSDVMISNYSIYCNEVWVQSKPELVEYAEGIQQLFEADNVTERLEMLVGVSLKSNFYASFCNSIKGGAQAIDIPNCQDIFGIDKGYEKTKKFIAHEYAIFLLMQALVVEFDLSNTMKYWRHLEGLAEFYLGMTLGESGIFADVQPIIDFYKNEYSENPRETAVGLFAKAIEVFK